MADWVVGVALVDAGIALDAFAGAADDTADDDWGVSLLGVTSVDAALLLAVGNAASACGVTDGPFNEDAAVLEGGSCEEASMVAYLGSVCGVPHAASDRASTASPTAVRFTIEVPLVTVV